MRRVVRSSIWFVTILNVVLFSLVVSRRADSQPGPEIVYREDFEDGLPSGWENGTFVSQRLPPGSRGAVASTPSGDIKSHRAWATGHFTVREGLYVNYWARLDRPRWYQMFVYCKTRGQEAKGMTLYAAKPPIDQQTGNQWHLVSLPLDRFKGTTGPNKGKSPTPDEVCWTYFWSFQKRDLGMTIDQVWITHGKPSDAQPPVPVSDPEAAPAQTPTWAFEPSTDEFDSRALLDLRPLNEPVAGQSGFVQRSDDGSDFVLGNGQPVRFWAANTSAYRKHPRFPAPDLARHARFLAKRGVNMVRFHGNITPKPGQSLTDIDKDEREQLWRLVAAMKKEGIYTTFSPYWAVSSRVKPNMGVADAGKAKNHGLLFIDPRLQAAYKSWMKQVLAEENPYTGIPLAEDPALAIIQLQNEDSLLFWTSQFIEGAAAKVLRRKYGQFLTEKYGTLRGAKDAWRGDSHQDDDFAEREVGLYLVWHLTQPVRHPGKHQRYADQMEFLSKTMYDFNTTMAEYLRSELGCRQLVNACNWRTADNLRMLDAERYAYTANEVVGINRYFTGIHQGPHKGWAIVGGDQFTDPSVLLRPHHLPLTLKQVEGHPIIITESSWVPPLSYQSEGPFLVAAYQSLTGIDAFYWFSTAEEGWRRPSSANGYLPSLGKWVCNTPMLMGQWPAAALMFRKGYIQQGEPVVQEQRSLSDLWFRRMPVIAETAGHDPNRDQGDSAQASNVPGGVNPLAFLVGPVSVQYGADQAKSQVVDLGKYIDTDQKTVRSVTGQLTWDYGRGLCVLDAPKAQGGTGFFGRIESVKLSDIEIRSDNEYATILVVALDDRALNSSHQVLVQVGTTQRPTGWKTRPVQLQTDDRKRGGEVVLNFGKAPWQIVRTDASVIVANPHLTTAHELDANGMPVRELPLPLLNGGRNLTLPAGAMYVVLSKS